MSRARLAALLIFIGTPAFSADLEIRELLVRYKTRPVAARTLAVPSNALIPAKAMRTAATLNTFRAALSALERTAVVAIPIGSTLEAELVKWRGRSDVELVEPNKPMRLFLSPNDPFYSNQWALRNTGQTGSHDQYDPSIGTVGSDVDAETAWNIQTGSNTIVIAVIDAGINITHPDLSANIVTGFDFGDNDSNPDDTCSNPNPSFDAHGHGTHVSGIAGAVGNNGTGVAGINWNSKIMPLKVADSTCGIFTDDVVAAINYARTNGAEVINMSLGGEASISLQTAIGLADAAGIVLVAAAGNEGVEDQTNSYPSAYPEVIAVAATDRNDQLAGFSNRGAWVDIAAPGVGILSTYPSSLGSYGYLSGTSMATPLVAGVAALILAENPGLTPAQVKARIEAAADDIDAFNNPGDIGKYGAGRLNAANALFSITSVSPSTAPNTGSVIVTMNGFNFSAGMTARLVRSGQSDIVGTTLGLVSTSVATVTFNLNGSVGGLWDVRLTKISGSSTTLRDGFGILSPTFNVVVLDPLFLSSATIQTVQGTTHTFVWPGGGLGQTVTASIDGAPLLEDVTSVDPFTSLLTGTGVELEVTPAQSALTQLLVMTLGYREVDLLDTGNESALVIARFDEDHNRWKPLVSSVDTQANTVTALVDHLSQFAIIQATAAANLSRALAYPNPFRAELGHNRVTFSFLTAGSQVRVYDVAGGLVRDLTDDNGDGQVYWDGVKTDGGDDLASGIYFYLITDPQGRKEKGRIGVIR